MWKQRGGRAKPPKLAIDEFYNTKPVDELRTVITLAEARYLTGMSRPALMGSIIAGRIRARKSITGGEILVLYADLIKIYRILPEREQDLTWIG